MRRRLRPFVPVMFTVIVLWTWLWLPLNPALFAIMLVILYQVWRVDHVLEQHGRLTNRDGQRPQKRKGRR